MFRWPVGASRISPRRALILYALGSALGLGLAGYELVNARGTQTRVVSAENVATVNGQPILRSDFRAQAESETGLSFERIPRSDAMRVLDEMVREELKVQRGLELGFAETDQDTRNALAAITEQQMGAAAVTSQPTAEEVRRFYEANPARYRTEGVMRVCGLTTTDLAVATRAVAALRSGTPLATASQQFGLVNRNGCEENFYFAIRLHLGDRLFKIAKTLPQGHVSDPVQIAGTFQILRIEANTPPVAQPFDAVQSRLASDYKADHEERLRRGTMNFLYTRAHILLAPDYADYRWAR